MTQQFDPKNPSTGQTEPLSPFMFEGHTGSGTGTRSSSSGSALNRYPFLLKIRQAATTFVVESAASTKPQREKLNVMALELWRRYLAYIQAFPLLTIFLTSLVVLSAGPVIVFACVTGISLTILVGVAAVIVAVIQSIVVGIAGAILLFVLGSIVVLTVITFVCIVAGYTGFKLARNIAVVLHGHHQQYVQKQQQQQQQPPQYNQTKGEKVDGSFVPEI
ncbi:hypothetical protein BGX27_000338 [Mortierella sp. AM989]|nr:hypothetical protein BGX27_000338 [Mortierella sp. AM989]